LAGNTRRPLDLARIVRPEAGGK